MNNNEQWIPQPTIKSEKMEDTIITLTGIDRRKSITNKLCGWCGADVTLESFKDELSLKEYHIGGLCQDCQDRVFG